MNIIKMIIHELAFVYNLPYHTLRQTVMPPQLDSCLDIQNYIHKIHMYVDYIIMDVIHIIYQVNNYIVRSYRDVIVVTTTIL